MRHREGAPNAAALEAGKMAAAYATNKQNRRASPRGVSDASFIARLDEVNAMLKTRQFENAEGIHFVALYADLHFRVYGLAPGDLAQKERTYAAKLAEDMLDHEFGGDRQKMSEFVSWTWTREKEREQWRRQQKRPGGRITWRSQFKGGLVTEYRLDEARKATR